MRVTVGSQGESIKMMEEEIDSTERTISKGFKKRDFLTSQDIYFTTDDFYRPLRHSKTGVPRSLRVRTLYSVIWHTLHIMKLHIFRHTIANSEISTCK